LDSGTDGLLVASKPTCGIGLNLAQELTERAPKKCPHLDFYTVEVDQVKAPENFCPQHVVMTNMLDYVYDVWNQLGNPENF
jgi:hypothetical protein